MVVLCPAACQCGKTAWNQSSLAACYSISTLQDDSRAAFQTSISRHYFQAAFLWSKERIKPQTNATAFWDTSTRPVGRQQRSKGGSCGRTMLPRMPCRDEAHPWLAVCPCLWAPLWLCLLIFPLSHHPTDVPVRRAPQQCVLKGRPRSLLIRPSSSSSPILTHALSAAQPWLFGGKEPHWLTLCNAPP